jgi:hypothetical protein
MMKSSYCGILETKSSKASPDHNKSWGVAALGAMQGVRESTGRQHKYSVEIQFFLTFICRLS